MNIQEIELNKIKFVENIRQEHFRDGQAELMQSIKQDGLMQPIGLQKALKGNYFIVWGHRRFLAFKKLGYKTIPSVILDTEHLTEEEFIIKNASENVQRKEITVLEFGRVCDFLRKSMSPSEIAVKLAVPVTRVKQALESYSNIPKHIQEQIKVFNYNDMSKGRGGMIPFSVASQIANLRNVDEKSKLLVYETARKEELQGEHITLLAHLLNDGIPLKQALNELKDWMMSSNKTVIKKDTFKEIINKYGSFSDFTYQKINNEYPNSCFKSRPKL